MDNNRFHKFTIQLGVSKATVSRTLRHCPGVDTETRMRILREAMKENDGVGYPPCRIYCILPDLPRYFWGTFFAGLQEEVRRAPVSVKFNLYTRISDDETVLLYLDEAVLLRAEVVIMAAAVSPEIREKLRRMQESGVCVILLSEYGEVPGSVYVGADAFRDGEAMGQWFCQRYPDNIPIILRADCLPNVLPRINGFRQALERYRPIWGGEIPVFDLTKEDLDNIKTIPARLAALLRSIDCRYSCIYIPFGNINLPLSIRKACLHVQDLILLTHDAFTEAGPGTLYPGYTASCNQNISGQVTAAMDIARSFLLDPVLPDRQTFYYIPSRILCPGDAAADGRAAGCGSV